MPPLGNGPRPSQVVLDGAEALRERAWERQAGPADLQDRLSDHWERNYERRRR